MSKFKPKVIVHAGFPKTGTTYIQNSLYPQRDKILKEYGILIPSLSANLTDALCTMFHDDPMVHITNKISQFSEEQIISIKEHYFRELNREIGSSNCEKVFLSAEGLANLNCGELLKFKNWIEEFSEEPQVLYCVREPIDWVRSVTQEIVKGGRTLESLYKEIPLPFYKRQIQWTMEVFGKECTKVYSYDAAKSNPQGILGTLSFYLGLSENFFSTLSPNMDYDNHAMSQEAVIILDRLNTLRPLFDQEGRLGPLRTGQEVVNFLRIAGSSFQLPADVETTVRQASAEDTRWLNDNFGIHFEYNPIPKKRSSNLRNDTAETLAILLSDLINMATATLKS